MISLKPVSETEILTDAESETKSILWKLEFRECPWAPTPDGAWERGLEETVRMLDEARAQVVLSWSPGT